MNVQVCDVACLFFLLYANLLVLVTLCEGNHYPFIEERYEKNLNNVAIRGNNMSYLQNLTLGNRCILSGKMASR